MVISDKSFFVPFGSLPSGVLFTVVIRSVREFTWSLKSRDYDFLEQYQVSCSNRWSQGFNFAPKRDKIILCLMQVFFLFWCIRVKAKYLNSDYPNWPKLCFETLRAFLRDKMANPLFGNWKLKGRFHRDLSLMVTDYPLSAEAQKSCDL